MIGAVILLAPERPVLQTARRRTDCCQETIQNP
jgi:hypothetical protein